jgi:dipeptidyl aminopeptidase/acylaminoacyl peptidase
MWQGCARRIAAGVCGLVLGATASAAPPPAEAFVSRPAIQRAVPSPSGKRLALVVATTGGRNALAVVDLPPTQPPRVVGGFSDGDIGNVRWVNDERLIFDAAQEGYWISRDGAGTIAVNHDGSGSRRLISWREANFDTGTRLVERVLNYEWSLLTTIADGSADVIVVQRQYSATGEVSGGALARLDTLTGRSHPVAVGTPSGAVGWVFDRKGELRVVRTTNGGRDKLHVRQADSQDWKVASDVPLFSDRAMEPLFLESDGGLIVSTNAGTDTVGLYAYDLKAQRLDPQALARSDRFDIDDAEFDPALGQVVAAHLTLDRPQTVWFSERLAGVQKAVDAALPAGRFNRIACGNCETSAFFLVTSRSDQQPAEHWVFDPTRRQLTRIGEAEGPTAPRGKRSFHWVAARDGLNIPVVVTHPPGRGDKEALPAVVLVHGGPWVRGASRRYDAEAQFLAAQGWRVLQPDFRGSTGYGEKLFRAGWKQWGQAMQDDLADTVQWAVAQGLVDAKHVCIYGASYGGYAALMGPVRNPELYRCAASFAGVTDIQLMFTSGRSDLTRDSRVYLMPQLVGDPDKDAEMLRKASPVERVAEIRVPVLLAQGTLDRRVPREHANRFEAAARKAGVAIERIDYGDAGHGFSTPAQHAEFLNKLAAFMARSLDQ